MSDQELIDLGKKKLAEMLEEFERSDNDDHALGVAWVIQRHFRPATGMSITLSVRDATSLARTVIRHVSKK